MVRFEWTFRDGKNEWEWKGVSDICEGINEDCQGCNRELCAYKKEIGVKLIHTSHPCTSSRCLILKLKIFTFFYIYTKRALYMCHDTISKEWKVHNKTAVQTRLRSFLFVVFLVVIFSTFCGRWRRMKDVAMMIIYIPSTLLTVSNFTFCYEKWEGAVTKEQKRNHLMLFKIKMLSFCFCNLLQFCQFVTHDFSP